MELLALLSNRDDEIIPEVKSALSGYTVYPLKTVEELEDLHTNIPLNLILIDTVSHKLSSLEGLLNKLNDDSVVLITPEKLDKYNLENLPRSVYDGIDAGSIRTELPVIVNRAIEKQRLKNEIELLKKVHDDYTTPSPFYDKSRSEDITFNGSALSQHLKIDARFPAGKHLPEKVLVNFAKMLTVSFDMKKLFTLFIESVTSIVHINKMSVMLRDEEGFYVKTHYGLDPYLADNLRLKKDSALVKWLAKTGRIMHKPVKPADTALINISKEMELLQCSFSFPLIHKGKLIGIFNIADKITGERFYREELEIIYVFCNYLAAAVKDIALYHQMWYQKEFTKNILSSVTSGMVVIDKDEKIKIFNQQASEILNLEPSKVLGSDLRSLPSPLGDILYESMIMGTQYKRYEVEVGPNRTPLGINSCRLTDKNQNPIGAGIIFNDLSDAKKLEEQKRKTERLEAVNSLMAKVAHEVRTPLTSIQTYVQILSEKYSGDKDLHDFFSLTVLQSIRNLDTLLDKLVIFSSKTDYNFSSVDARVVFDEAVNYILKNIPGEYKFINRGIDGQVFITVDKKFLIKAFYYLILCIIERMDKEKVITMSGRSVMQDPPHVEILFQYNGNAIKEVEKQNLLKPLADIHSLGSEFNMPISQKIIIEGHKGSINIRSEEGSNIFIVTLPAVDRRNVSSTNRSGDLNGAANFMEEGYHGK